MKKITFCIPSKTNLRYLKTCIPSIRKNASRPDHDIIVFVDSDEDGTVEWLETNAAEWNVKYFVNPYLGEKLFGIGKAYDYCIEQAETDVVMIFHADMMLGKDADLNAYKHLSEGRVVCATRIEPPLHPNAGEKILRDYGIWPEEFKEQAFDSYVTRLLQENKDKVTTGIFAPWMIYKKDILGIGGHDPILKSCREDSDLFNRFKLNGYELIQSWDSLVYHLTGRGAGSFDGDKERHVAWQREMEASTREFIRKWGSNVNHTAMMDPIITPKYDIGIKVTGCNSELLELLEPWCTTILIDDEMQVLTSHYVDREQKNTTYNLLEKIKTTPYNTLTNEIVVHIDRSTFTLQDFQYLQMLPNILKENNVTGKFKLNNSELVVHSLTEYQNTLITL